MGERQSGESERQGGVTDETAGSVDSSDFGECHNVTPEKLELNLTCCSYDTEILCAAQSNLRLAPIDSYLCNESVESELYMTVLIDNVTDDASREVHI